MSIMHPEFDFIAAQVEFGIKVFVLIGLKLSNCALGSS